MNKSTIVLLLLMACIGCNQGQNKSQPYKPLHLVKLTEEELISDAKNRRTPDLEKMVFKTVEGEVVSRDELEKIIMDKTLVPDFYKNEEGTIVEAVIRKETTEDKVLMEKLEAAFNEGPDIALVDIDCENKNKILDEAHGRDQGNRTNKFNPEIDRENLNIIISLIEQCGMPTLAEVSPTEMSAVWLVLQHAPARYQSRYIPRLEESAKNGDIEWSVIALMKDRALMYEGKPQLYGSQVEGNQLYDLFEPEYVDQRRAEKGMEPLAEYLKLYNSAYNVEVEFSVEQKSK